MRKKILDYHNQARIRLAKGEERNKTGRLPSAKNMYQLSWCCELEKKAEAAIAVCPENLSDLTGYGTNFGTRYHCPRYPRSSEQLVMDELGNWWGEVRKYGMTDAKNRYIKEDMRFSMDNWANMANGKNTKIGCSYTKIKGKTVFLCAYDDRSSVARGLEPDAAGGNAPKAEQMLKMIYDCPSEKIAFKLAKKCPAATRPIYSHNWNMHKVSSTSTPDEAAADEMAKDVSYKLGCVIYTCSDGKYVHCLSTPTYEQ
ncbi:SCP-like protein [Ancylostoma ceylanicum]|uniref:SCP-like protein n=1 Tax=Ancylostoma ceylanicum TaxID=53326 RepID=A0A0D6LDW7_9BILA|nr:SCP-like protein [Ancylostoma ceylanicum]